MSEGLSVIETVLREQRTELLDAWVKAQVAAPGVRTDLISETEMRVESDRFLNALAAAFAADTAATDVSGPAWDGVREQLTDLSRTRATRGFTPTETATFVFSLKEPLFARAARQGRRHRRRDLGGDPAASTASACSPPRRTCARARTSSGASRTS